MVQSGSPHLWDSEDRANYSTVIGKFIDIHEEQLGWPTCASFSPGFP